MRINNKNRSSVVLSQKASPDHIPHQPNLYEGESLLHFLDSIQSEIKRARLTDESLPHKIWLKQQFSIGVNDVTRVLERMTPVIGSISSVPQNATYSSRNSKSPSIQMQAILIATDCNPRGLTKHLPSLASSREVPVIFVKDKKGGSFKLGEMVNLKTAMAIGVKARGNSINKLIGEILGDNQQVTRYLEDTHIVECKDQGVEFIHSKVINVKYEDIVGSEQNLKMVDEFIPSALGAVDQVADPLLSIKVTTFEYGGVALGVSVSHRVADTATLCIFLNEWAAISRGESHAEFPGPGFNSASFFPARGLTPTQRRQFPRTKSSDNMHRSKYVTKKLSFNDSEISKLRDKIIGNQQDCSKVQLVSALIWKALIDIDQRTNGGYPPRCSVLLWPINLRGKTISLIPKDSSGNLTALLVPECKTNVETTLTLVNLLRSIFKNFMDNYSKVRHDNEQVQTMVSNSLSYPSTIPPNADVISLTSWCNFPFYQVDFGFGKPIWVNRGRAIGKNSGYMLDGAGGNGIEAYVGVEDKDVSFFEEALDIKAFTT